MTVKKLIGFIPSFQRASVDCYKIRVHYSQAYFSKSQEKGLFSQRSSKNFENSSFKLTKNFGGHGSTFATMYQILGK